MMATESKIRPGVWVEVISTKKLDTSRLLEEYVVHRRVGRRGIVGCWFGPGVVVKHHNGHGPDGTTAGYAESELRVIESPS